MSEINHIPDFDAMARQLVTDAMDFAETTGEEFFKESFEKGGFTDVAFEKWADPKQTMPGYKSLQRTGMLRDSVGAMERGNTTIAFGSDMPYAAIHNEGGTITITITDKMRKYFWFMYKASNNGMWKAMALTKKQQLTIKIPQRQFVGESATLMATLDAYALNAIQTRFRSA